MDILGMYHINDEERWFVTEDAKIHKHEGTFSFLSNFSVASRILAVLIGLLIVFLVIWHFETDDPVIKPMRLQLSLQRLRINILRYKNEYRKYPDNLDEIKNWGKMSKDALSDLENNMTYYRPPDWISGTSKPPANVVLLSCEFSGNNYYVITLDGVLKEVSKEELEQMIDELKQ